jgi:hypothetical protein
MTSDDRTTDDLEGGGCDLRVVETLSVKLSVSEIRVWNVTSRTCSVSCNKICTLIWAPVTVITNT